MTLPRFDAKAAGAAVVTIAIAVAMVLVVQAGAATAKPTDVVIGTKAPVKPAQFRGDVRRLKRPVPFPRRPTVEPGEHEDVEKKTGAPAASPIPKATTAMPATIVNFAGLDFANWGAGWPPDTVGDVGPNHYIQAVNTSIGIWAKTGGPPVAAFTFNTLWSGTSTPCDNNNNGDPTVIYDQMADRWIVADFAWTNIENGPYYECIAVSKTGNPVTGGWWLYAYQADDAAHPWLPDYPKMGIWPDGLYMTTNMFDCLNATCSSASYKEPRVYAFDRADMYAGAPLSSFVVDLNNAAYMSLLPSNLRGAPPPAGRENFLIAESTTVFEFQVWKFHVDWVTPVSSTFTGPTIVNHPSYNLPVSVPQPGVATLLDSLGDRMQMQNQYRNLGGVESLWVNHTVRTGPNPAPNGLHWAQINVTGGTIGSTPVQQQIYGNLGGDGVHRWMGSLAVDGQGNMALGYSVSNSSVFPGIRYNGRLAGDPLNTLPQGEATLQAGGGSQNGISRWGDYSAMTVDPDDCTFWYTTEYYATTGTNWQTRIGSFKFPSCTPAPAIAAPQLSAVAEGSEVGVFGRNPDNELWYRETTSGSFGAWTKLSTSTNVASRPKAVMVGSDLYVFFRSTANDLRYFKRTGGTWGTEQNLGGVIAGSPAAAVDGDGDLIVAVRTSAGVVFFNRLPSGGSWTGFSSLDGIIPGQLELVGYSGNVHLFGVDPSGLVWYRMWSAAANTWGAWTTLNGVIESSLSATVFGSDLYFFGLDPGGLLWYRALSGGVWGAWTTLDGILGGTPDAAATASTLLAFGTNPQGLLWDRRKTGAAAFTAWEALDGVLSSGPEAVTVGTQTYVFALDTAQGLWYRLWNGASFGAWTYLGGVLATE